jgi:hypothetical protein
MGVWSFGHAPQLGVLAGFYLNGSPGRSWVWDVLGDCLGRARVGELDVECSVDLVDEMVG